MAGYREFQTGEVLTAANVNDFLGKQSVMKFADAAARNTALGTAVGGSNALREGMVAYLDDTDELLKYDGTAWTGVGGGLVAVKSAIFTGTQSASVTAGSNLSVTDLTITHETADAANKLIISAFVGSAGSSNGRGNVGIAIHDGTNLIGIGDADGSRTRVTAGGFPTDSAATPVSIGWAATFIHVPGAGSKTYTVRLVNITAGTETLFVNRGQRNDDAAYVQRAASSLVIQEVSV